MNIDKNEFFREVTLRIGSSLDVNEALENLFNYIKKVFPADGLTLNYRDVDGGIYSISLAGSGPRELAQNQYATVVISDEENEYLRQACEKTI